MAKKKPQTPPWALTAAKAKNPPKSSTQNPLRATPLERARMELMERFELLARDPRLAELPDRALIRVQVVDPAAPERRLAFTVGLSDYDERGWPCFMMITRGPRRDVLAAILMHCDEQPEDAWAAHFQGHSMWVYELHEPSDIRADERDLVIGAPPSGRTGMLGVLSGQRDISAVNFAPDADAVARCSAVVDVLQRALAAGTLEAPPFELDAALLELQPDATGCLGPPIEFTDAERELFGDSAAYGRYRATLADLSAPAVAALTQRVRALPLLKGDRATLTMAWTSDTVDLASGTGLRYVDVALLDTDTLAERASLPLGRTLDLSGDLYAQHLALSETLLARILDLFERVGGLPEHLTLELAYAEEMLSELVLRVRAPRPQEPAPIVDIQSASGPATFFRRWVQEAAPKDPERRTHHALAAALDWLVCIGSRSVGVDALAVSAFASAEGGNVARLAGPDVEENAVHALAVLSATLDTNVVEPWFDARAPHAPQGLQRALAAWAQALPDLCVWSEGTSLERPEFQSLLTGEKKLHVVGLPEGWKPQGGGAVLLVLCAELDGVQRREAPLPIARGQADAWARALGEVTPAKRRAAALHWLRGALTV